MASVGPTESFAGIREYAVEQAGSRSRKHELRCRVSPEDDQFLDRLRLVGVTRDRIVAAALGLLREDHDALRVLLSKRVVDGRSAAPRPLTVNGRVGTCEDCFGSFEHARPGRLPKRCPECRHEPRGTVRASFEDIRQAHGVQREAGTGGATR